MRRHSCSIVRLAGIERIGSVWWATVGDGVWLWGGMLRASSGVRWVRKGAPAQTPTHAHTPRAPTPTPRALPQEKFNLSPLPGGRLRGGLDVASVRRRWSEQAHLCAHNERWCPIGASHPPPNLPPGRGEGLNWGRGGRAGDGGVQGLFFSGCSGRFEGWPIWSGRSDLFGFVQGCSGCLGAMLRRGGVAGGVGGYGA